MGKRPIPNTLEVAISDSDESDEMSEMAESQERQDGRNLESLQIAYGNGGCESIHLKNPSIRAELSPNESMGKDADLDVAEIFAHKEVANQPVADEAPAFPAIGKNSGSAPIEVGTDQKLDEDKSNNATGSLKASPSISGTESNSGEDPVGNISPSCRSEISAGSRRKLRERRDRKKVSGRE